MAAMSHTSNVSVERTTISLNQLETVPLPNGIAREVFAAVANVMTNVTEVEGIWHGQIVVIIPDQESLDNVSRALKQSNAAKGILAAKMSYLKGGSEFEGEMVDIMDWDGSLIVNGSNGVIIGVKRQLVCDAQACPIDMAGNWGSECFCLQFIFH